MPTATPTSDPTGTATVPVQPGIISGQLNGEGYTASQLNDPNQWKVTSDQTTQGQMQNLADPNSPFYQSWATAGKQAAAANGFTGNSTMRDTGILNSVIQNATPIAQSDAATYAKAAGYNVDQQNQFAATNANAQNRALSDTLSSKTSKENAQMAAMASASAASASAAASMHNAEVQAAASKYVSDNSTSSQWHATDTAFKTSGSNAAMTANTNYNNTVQAILGSSMDPDKANLAIQQANASYTTQINVIGTTYGIDTSMFNVGAITVPTSSSTTKTGGG